jgi:hypothetical protein
MGKLGRWVARVGLPVANSSQAATTEDSQKPLPLTFEAGHDFVAFFFGGVLAGGESDHVRSMAEWSIPHFPPAVVSGNHHLNPLVINHGKGTSSIFIP